MEINRRFISDPGKCHDTEAEEGGVCFVSHTGGKPELSREGRAGGEGRPGIDLQHGGEL